MEKVLKGLQYETCLVYLDDIIVKGQTFEEHLKNLNQVFDRSRAAGLKLSPKKCTIFQKSVTFLGHVVSEFGISTDQAKVVAVKNWPRPGCVKKVRSFLGFCSYYWKFIKDFATIAKPLVKLTEKNVKFGWIDKCEGSFNRLKGVMTEAPVLAYPDMTKKFILDTDASGVGVGAVLSQMYDGKERVIGYLKCQKRNFLSKCPRAPLKQYPVGVPFERVGTDILGPLPESKRGNKYIVVIGD